MTQVHPQEAKKQLLVYFGGSFSSTLKVPQILFTAVEVKTKDTLP
jgi:hypothetical protein